jgi:pimeloyl-ACP methyl ester carboxylesterase
MHSQGGTPVEEFVKASFAERLRMIRDAETAREVASWWGQAEVDRYRETAAQFAGGHLSADAAPNLIFLPGVMGSLLASRGLGGIWWVDARSRRHIDDLRLTPDGHADDHAGADLAPIGVDCSYEQFFAAAYRTGDFSHVVFPYDWRKPVPTCSDSLAALIEDTSRANGGRPVHLVAHSMGGLVVRATLLRHPRLWPLIGRIVFLGTPHYGSPAIAGYLKDHLGGFNLLALLGRYLSRETFRSLWGPLALLPAPTGVYPGTRTDEPATSSGAGEYVHPCANFDLYHAPAWQLGLDEAAERRLQTVLDGTARLHRELDAWHRSLGQDQRDKMAVIAGVGYRSLFRLTYPEGGRGRMERVTRRRAGDPDREGDGRVPVASASLESVGDIGYVRGEHGRLPCLPVVYEEVFRLLSGLPMTLPTTPEHALRRHLGDPADDPLGDDDPGYLQPDPPGPDQLSALDDALSLGRLPDFTRVRLL